MATTSDEPQHCLACDAPLGGAAAFAAVDRLHRSAGEFTVVVCPSCSSGTTAPLARPRELAAFYPTGYGPYEDPANPLIALISRAIRAWQAYRGLRSFPLRALRDRPGRGVDVGCGRGDLAAALIGAGWTMTGVEPSPDAAANARARGVEVRIGTLADVALPADAYDAAVFQHSLEHTPDPLGDLQRLHGTLAPGGIVAITVPNFSNWQPRRLRSRWYHLDVPRHRTHFTPRGLTALLQRSGYQLIELRTSTSSVGLPATIQYALAGRCLFPDGLALRVATGLCALNLPLAVAADRLGGGGDQLHVLARRA
jgi:SAM-dependent methyltransferase